MRSAGLALAVRALRLDARSSARGGQRMAIVLLLIGALIWSRTLGAFMGAPGQALLGTLLFVNAGAIALLGIGTFAAVIAEEKEERTLGLLRLAGFGPLPLLAGKSAGELCTAALLLAVQVPFALLSVTLGGVAARQVAAGYAVLGAFLLAIYGVALLASVVCARTRTAGLWTAAVLLGSSLSPLIAAPLLVWLGSSPGVVLGAVEACWSLTVWGGLASTLQGPVDMALVQRVGVLHLAVGAVAAALAWLVFEPCNREEHQDGGVRGRAGRRRTGVRSRPAAGAAAVFWKDYHFVAGGRAGLRRRALFYTLLGIVLWLYEEGPWGRVGGAWLPEVVSAYAGWCFCFLALDCGALAARVFRTETKGETLPTLAALPLPLKTVAYRKVGGCLVALLPGALGLGCAVLVSTVLNAARSGLEASYYRQRWWADVWVEELTFWSLLGANLVLGAHFAAYYSLVVARGALMLAIASVFGWVLCEYLLSQACVTRWMSPSFASYGMQPSEIWAVLMLLATLGAAALLHKRIAAVLAAAAGR